METQQLVSPSRQCSSTPVSFGQIFLSKQQPDTKGAFPILSWLGSSWFLLVPMTDISTLGMALLCANENIKNATEELKRLSKMAYRNVSNALQSPAKMSSYTRGLFWTKCSLNGNVLHFSAKNWFREHLKPQRIISPVVLYGCKVWYQVKGRRQKEAFGDMVSKEAFGHNSEGAGG